jgi:hypothetical protein
MNMNSSTLDNLKSKCGQFQLQNAMLRSLIAATLGGIPGECTGYAAFTVRTLMQSGQYSNMHHAISTIYSANGIKGFYRGIGLSLCTAPLGNFLYIQGMKVSINLFGDNPFGHAMQGFTAQAGGSIIWGPAKRFMELQQMPHTGNSFSKLSLWGKIKSTWKQDGLRGLYRGTLPQYMSFATTNALAFTIKNNLDNRISNPSVLSDIATTATGFSIASVMFNPIDVITTRLQIAELSANPTSSIYIASKQVMQGGINVMWKGSISRAVWLTSRAAITLPIATNLEKLMTPTPETLLTI